MVRVTTGDLHRHNTVKAKVMSRGHIKQVSLLQVATEPEMEQDRRQYRGSYRVWSRRVEEEEEGTLSAGSISVGRSLRQNRTAREGWQAREGGVDRHHRLGARGGLRRRMVQSDAWVELTCWIYLYGTLTNMICLID